LQILLGDRIRIARKHAHLTQAELARRVGISKQAIWEIEANNVTDPGVKKILAIANVLNVSTDELLGRDLQLTPA
jgi:transcriptional regulator with XRE-family HTH domain